MKYSIGLTFFTLAAVLGEPVPHFVDLFNGKDLTGWVNVNTDPDTWKMRDGMLICTGHPIGVMRSVKAV